MKKLFISLLISLLVFPDVFGQSAENNTALVLIDIQEFYFDEGKMPLEGNIEAAEQASALLEFCRKNQYLVIHVRHKGGGAIHELVKPQNNEKVIEKDQVNAFKGTELLNYLKEHKIENLVLAGMQTHMCLEAATRAGADYGFNCTVIHDACATRDLEFEGTRVKAEDVHASTLNTLRAYAKIISLKDYLN